MLSLFEAECPLALNDPQSFISRLETVGVTQGQVVRTSPDQALFEASGRLGGYLISADWSNYGTHTLRHCTISLGDGVAIPSPIGPYLQNWFQQRSGFTLSGGEVPPSFDGGGTGLTGYARFVINDFIKSPLGTTFATVQTAPGWLSISVSVTHKNIPVTQ